MASDTITLASFNINGVKARLPVLLGWLAERAPDLAVLQEIKSEDAKFPRAEIEALGYHVATHGQKGFNGVAILSKRPLEDISRGLPGDPDDAQARWIEATVSLDRAALKVCCLYLPNGNPAFDDAGGPSEKYAYKLRWMARLEARVKAILAEETACAFAGDWNVIPQAEDAATPSAWARDALFLPATREAFRRIAWLGLTDALRSCRPGAETFTFWDYQAGAWRRNDGIGIDHILLTPQAADRLSDAWVEKDLRGVAKDDDGAGPSDHTPLWCRLRA